MKYLKNKKIQFIIKASFVTGLLVFLSKKGFMSVEATRQAFQQWDLLLTGYLALLFTSVLSVVRWHYLLKAQEIHLPFSRIFQLAFIGNFFNIALPGAVSGDVIKAIYVAKESPGKRAHSLSSILFDRVAGVSALVFVSLGAIIASTGNVWAGKLLNTIQLVVALFGGCVFAFYVYLFLIKENFDPLLKLFRFLESKYNFFGSFTRIYEGIRTYHHSKGVVIGSLFLSAIIHLLVTFACIQFTYATGETQLPWLALMIVIPLGLFFTAIPVMPAGIGTGHAAFLALYALLDSQRGADIFNLFLLYQLFQGAMGGLIYLRFKATGGLDLSLPSEAAPS